MAKYTYFKSSKTEKKHEISRKEFIKLLGESDFCVKTTHVANGLYMDSADYKDANRLLRNAQRDRTGGTIWPCKEYTLYLDKDFSEMRRSRDSRYPD